jgi:hypothetical protein
VGVSDGTAELCRVPVRNSTLRVGDLLVTRIGTWVIVESRSRSARSERFRPAQGFVWIHRPTRHWEFVCLEIEEWRQGDRVWR